MPQKLKKQTLEKNKNPVFINLQVLKKTLASYDSDLWLIKKQKLELGLQWYAS